MTIGAGNGGVVASAVQIADLDGVVVQLRDKPMPISEGDCSGIITWGCDRNCSPIFDPYPKSRRQKRRGKNVTVGKSLFGHAVLSFVEHLRR